jgi:hypothetical protein
MDKHNIRQLKKALPVGTHLHLTDSRVGMLKPDEGRTVSGYRGRELEFTLSSGATSFIGLDNIEEYLVNGTSVTFFNNGQMILAYEITSAPIGANPA